MPVKRRTCGSGVHFLAGAVDVAVTENARSRSSGLEAHQNVPPTATPLVVPITGETRTPSAEGVSNR